MCSSLPVEWQPSTPSTTLHSCAGLHCQGSQVIFWLPLHLHRSEQLLSVNQVFPTYIQTHHTYILSINRIVFVQKNSGEQNYSLLVFFFNTLTGRYLSSSSVHPQSLSGTHFSPLRIRPGLQKHPSTQGWSQEPLLPAGSWQLGWGQAEAHEW